MDYYFSMDYQFKYVRLDYKEFHFDQKKNSIVVQIHYNWEVVMWTLMRFMQWQTDRPTDTSWQILRNGQKLKEYSKFGKFLLFRSVLRLVHSVYYVNII